MIRLDHDDFVNLRKIEFLESQQDHPFASQLRLIEPPPPRRATPGEDLPSLFAYLVEDGAPPTCSRFPDSSAPSSNTAPQAAGTAATARKRPRPGPPSDDFEGIDETAPTPIKALPVPSSSTFARTASAPDAYGNPAKMAAAAAARRLALGQSHSIAEIGTSTSTKHRGGPRLSSHLPVATPLLEVDEDDVADPSSSTTVPDFRPDQAIVFPAGSYDVTLVLDAREVESKSGRDNFSEAIRAKGVNVETRALRLGDILWIAKRRDGLGGEEDECVLDYVVERKRLDDLCISIKDGRYTEQCVSGCSYAGSFVHRRLS